MTIETTEAIDITPSHLFEQGVKARLDAAAVAVAAADAAEGEASEEVDRLRGDVQLNLADRGRLLVAQRRLSKLQSTAADARSAERAIGRQIQAERDQRDQVAQERERRDRAELAARRALQKARADALLDKINAALVEIDGLDALRPSAATSPHTASSLRSAAENARSWIRRYQELVTRS